MIDWHSHILPGIDDGSRDVQQSLEMLSELSRQGVDTVIATPHFYADRIDLESFIINRQLAYESLKEAVTAEMPEIYTGAEVYYYSGISRMEGLEKLCIEGTNLFLLEMPMMKWTDYTVKEISSMAAQRGLVVILAHMERYLKLQEKRTWDRLLENGILMQSNASFFLEFGTKRKALNMLKEQRIHLIGSDCHNLTTRAPRIGAAAETIECKLGKGFLRHTDGFGRRMLNKEEKQTI